MKLKIRLIITVLVMAVLVVPLATIEPFAGQIGERLETLSSLEDDGSANARKESYTKHTGLALTSLVGQGMGDNVYDSAILTMLINFGWLGTIPYISGLFLLALRLFTSLHFPSDLLVSAAQGIVIGSLVQIPFGSPMVELKGIMLWGFLGIGMAASNYYQYQSKAQKDNSVDQFNLEKINN